ncbi:MAG: GNAT family N-acetyltransferase [Kouleothrix sp.]|nr:GNAT family N-acetyltransferase [Kouleothrix sp.]
MKLDYGPVREDEADALDTIVAQALFFPTEDMRSWRLQLGTEHFRAARRNGRLVAGLGIIPMGQWFGGLSVPIAGITAVGVAPEQRGGGVGLEMMRRCLEEIHASGTPLSALYPATVTFYRRAGYERAATRTVYEIAPDAIGVRDHTLDVVAVEEQHEPEIRRVYGERARHSSGNLDRHEFIWQALHHSKKHAVHRYLVSRDGRAEGYIAFTQAGRQDPLNVRDICALTPDAGRRLLTLLADHRTMVERITWSGAPNDLLLFLMPESKHKVEWAIDLLLRIVDVVAALGARGYPGTVDTELHIDVRDDVLPWNNGRFVLQVAEGRGSARPGGQGRIRLHARDLAALYGGYMTPQELRAAGSLDGPDADLAAAALVFAGPRPWTPDMF